MLVGSGIKGAGGTVLVYRSRDLAAGGRREVVGVSQGRVTPAACERLPGPEPAGGVMVGGSRSRARPGHARPAPAPAAGWRYDGQLCQGAEAESGTMWECPSLVQLSPHSSEGG
jgi:hypothetical protein